MDHPLMNKPLSLSENPVEQDLLARRTAVVPTGAARVTTLVVDRAEGSYLLDPEGRRYLDFTTGIGVMALGHSHPEVLAAAKAQLDKLQHICFAVATYSPYVELCEALARRFPHGERTKAYLMNSGAEAVENAVKIARMATGRPAILCFTEAFHGRTLLGVTLTSKAGYKVGCGPYAPEVYRLQYPNYYRYGDGLSLDAFVERELRRFEQALISVVPASQVAAVLLEVVQGEGGFVPAPVAWLQGLQRICASHGILLICDEVQSGMGRTGAWAGYEHAGITPDLSTWAKALGNGFPIAAVVGRASVMDRTPVGTLGTTYGGNPLACAAALAVLNIMERDDIPGRARHLGELLSARLLALKARSPLVADVRGIGAMLAMELTHGAPHLPATEATKRIEARCFERGLLLILAGAHSNIIRLLIPLTVSEADLARGLDILEQAVLEEV